MKRLSEAAMKRFNESAIKRLKDVACHLVVHFSSPFSLLIIYTLLALILTYPLVFNLTTTVPNDIGDPLLNTWILAWDSHALLTNPLNLFNANIFHPLPNTLAYSEHLFSTALLALPVQAFSSEPILAYNLSLLASFPLAGFGMYLLALRWTRRREAAFIAGLVFAFNPYRFAAIAHLQLLTFGWLPFIILFVDLLLTKRGLGVGGQRLGIGEQVSGKSSSLPLALQLLALVTFVWLQILASWYLAVYTAMILGIYLLVVLITQRFPFARLRPANLLPATLLLATLLLVTLLTLPLALPYLPLLNDLRAARPLSLALSLAAAPTDFAAAAPFNRLFGSLTESLRARPGFTEENMLFVGVIAPLLVLVSVGCHGSGVKCHVSSAKCHVLRFTFYALLFMLAFSIALTFSTPYTILATLLPPSTVVRVPPRWIIPALFALAGLAAFGYNVVAHYALRITHAVRSTQYVIILLTSGLLIAESLSIPLPLAPVDNHQTLKPAYHWLAAQPGPLALIELPLHSAPAPEYPEVKRLYASTLGWWGLVNGYSGYTPPRQPQLAQALVHFPDTISINTLQALNTCFLNTMTCHFEERSDEKSSLRLVAKNRLGDSSLPLVAQNDINKQALNDSSQLYLLVHPGEAPLDRAAWETTARWQAERNPNLYPIGEFQGDYLYRVLPADPNRFTAPLAVFGLDKNTRLLAVIHDTTNISNTLRLSASRLSSPPLLLYWQATTSLPADYTVFIHLRAADGFVRAQADGPPVSGHYPTTQWVAGEVIQDMHLLPEGAFDHIAIGLYDPTTGERLPAFGPDGKRLAEDAVIFRGDAKQGEER